MAAVESEPAELTVFCDADTGAVKRVSARDGKALTFTVVREDNKSKMALLLETDSNAETLSESQGLGSPLHLNGRNKMPHAVNEDFWSRQQRKHKAAPVYPREKQALKTVTATPSYVCAWCKTSFSSIKHPVTGVRQVQACTGCQGHYLCNELCQQSDLTVNKHYKSCPGYLGAARRTAGVASKD